jgi:GAF domain-containing protein
MIGWSVANKQWRVALEAKEDEVRLATPELPETRSEAALPLHSRGRVIGALTVQDRQSAAFDEETMVVLQTMADQVAVALDNARLYAQSQEALEAERRAYGEISREAWQQMVYTRATRGYRCDERGVVALPGESQAAQEGRTEGEGQTVIAVPIPVRDQVIGTLNFRMGDDKQAWTDQEVTLLQEMAQQLGLALDSARLYQDTQRRAAREQLTTEITARIRESLDIEAVLKAAAQEVRQALGVPEVVVRLASASSVRGTSPQGGDGRSSDADNGQEG